uniref:Uncharacterized protein n=1 Tax=Arion vulgaris TaxID=1028688 RepID=A0A0B7BPS9_9EUPU
MIGKIPLKLGIKPKLPVQEASGLITVLPLFFMHHVLAKTSLVETSNFFSFTVLGKTAVLHVMFISYHW